ncbi:amidohydrolase family protein [Amycolatopsis rhabdoformis]|uniref:Amidohydrolase family protein n=1 Tax=Amycolatopsis rhabdoformis TaxID=1448059 RepID=A0ABZ1ICP0_9PSEU|nr:amidohydrolase family protein [Amycolatopsis rhabdoformis]WSE32235.1 amidohydrolase family protein [Amycolatopsis rhabdoformis]
MPTEETSQAPWRVSSDTHIVEPPDLFLTRMSKQYLDYAPRLEKVDGVEMWVAEGQPGLPAFVASRAGDRFEPLETRPNRASPSTYGDCTFADDVREGGFNPRVWLDDNEADGVYGGAVFASLTFLFYSMISDTLVLNDIFRAYNDWALDFASEDRDRIKPITMLNLDDIDHAIVEMTRMRDRGAVGACIPVSSPDGYDHVRYERFWAAAQDLNVPLNMHVASIRSTSGFGFVTHSSRQPHIDGPYTTPGMVNTPDMHVRTSLVEMIMSGVFRRYPGLQVVSVENEGSWMPYFMQRMDWHYKYNLRSTDKGYRLEGDLLPSDYVRSNVLVSFTEDAALMRMRDEVGIDRLMWGSDYPHAESTFPLSGSLLDEQFVDVPADEQRTMVQENCAKLYGFDVAKLEAGTAVAEAS